jgi:hypothetical protein
MRWNSHKFIWLRYNLFHYTKRSNKPLIVETHSRCTQMRFDEGVLYTMAYCSCGSRYKPTQSAAIVPLFQAELLQHWNEADMTPHIYSVNMGSDISVRILCHLDSIIDTFTRCMIIHNTVVSLYRMMSWFYAEISWLLWLLTHTMIEN